MGAEISRRNFLKAAAATAGIVAVGIPTAVLDAAQPVAKAFPVVVEPGEVWAKIDGEWCLIGRSANITVYPVVEKLLARNYPDEPVALDGLKSTTVDIEILCDDFGGNSLCRALFNDADAVEMAIGFIGGVLGLHVFARAWDFAFNASPTDEYCRFAFNGECTGPLTIDTKGILA